MTRNAMSSIQLMTPADVKELFQEIGQGNEKVDIEMLKNYVKRQGYCVVTDNLEDFFTQCDMNEVQ